MNSRGQASFELLITLILMVASIPVFQAMQNGIAQSDSVVSLQNQVKLSALQIDRELALVSAHQNAENAFVEIQTMRVKNAFPTQLDDCTITLTPALLTISFDSSSETIALQKTVAIPSGFTIQNTMIRCGDQIQLLKEP